MIRFSAALVVAGLGLLLAGALSSELPLVYAAIGVSVIAAIMLAIGVIAGRDEIFGRELSAKVGGQAAAGLGSGHESTAGLGSGQESSESAGNGRASARGAAPRSAAAATPADDRVPAGKAAVGRHSGQEGTVGRHSGQESAAGRHSGQEGAAGRRSGLEGGVSGGASAVRDTLSAGPTPGHAATSAAAASFVPAPAVASPPARHRESAPEPTAARPSAENPVTPADAGSSGLGWPAGKLPSDELWARVEAELSASGPAAHQAAPKLTKDSATQEVWERVEQELTKPATPWSPWEQSAPSAASPPSLPPPSLPRSSLPPPSSLAPPATRSPVTPPPFGPPTPAEPETTRPWEPPSALSDPAPAKPAPASDQDLPALPRRPPSTGPSTPGQARSWADEWPAFKDAPGWTIDRAGRYAEPDEEPQASADAPATDEGPAGSGEPASTSTPEPATSEPADELAEVGPAAGDSGAAARDELAEAGPAAGESSHAARDALAEADPAAAESRPAARDELAEAGAAASESSPAARDESAEAGPAAAESRPAARDELAEAGPAAAGESGSAVRDELAEAGPAGSESGSAPRDEARDPARTGGFAGFDWSRPAGVSAEPGTGAEAETGKPTASAADDRENPPPPNSDPASATGSFPAFDWSRRRDASTEPKAGGEDVPATGSAPSPAEPDRTDEPDRAGDSEGASEPVQEAPIQEAPIQEAPIQEAPAPRTGAFSAFGWSREPSASSGPVAGPAAGGGGDQVDDASAATAGSAEGLGTTAPTAPAGQAATGWAPPSLGSRTTPGEPAADDAGQPRGRVAEALSGGRSGSGGATHTSSWPSSPSDRADRSDRTMSGDSGLPRGGEKAATLGGGATAADGPRLSRGGTAASAELQFGLGRGRPASGDRPVPSDDTDPDRGTTASGPAAAEGTAPDPGEPKPHAPVPARDQARDQMLFGLGRRTAPGREPAAGGETSSPAETRPDDRSAPGTEGPGSGGSRLSGGWGLPGSGGAPGEAAPGPGRTTAADMAGATERAPAFGGAVTPAPDKADVAPAPRWGAATGSTPGMVAKPGHVIVVQGVPRYHKSGCILIRFLGQNDLEQLTREAAEAAGYVPCRACQPDKPELSGPGQPERQA